MQANPYASPVGVTDEPPRRWDSEVLQMIYTVAATLAAGAGMSWTLLTVNFAEAMSLIGVAIFCGSIGGLIVGPLFFLIAFVQWFRKTVILR